MGITLSEQDLALVEKAVHEAELRTSGEIVPFVVERSASYPVAAHRAAAACGALGLLIVLVASIAYRGWGLSWLFSVRGTALVAMAAAVAGFVAVHFSSAVERLFAGGSTMMEAVRNRAARAFVDEEVFDTRERTGILLFISLFERRVEVVGDSGINVKVDPEDWARVVEDVLVGIRSGNVADGMVNAVERCGSLLEAKGVQIRDDDTNELPDSVRLG